MYVKGKYRHASASAYPRVFIGSYYLRHRLHVCSSCCCSQFVIYFRMFLLLDGYVISLKIVLYAYLFLGYISWRYVTSTFQPDQMYNNLQTTHTTEFICRNINNRSTCHISYSEVQGRYIIYVLRLCLFISLFMHYVNDKRNDNYIRT